MLCCALAEVGPAALSGIGAVTVAASYTSALALRSGGRPVVYGVLAVVIGVAALWLDEDFLRSGAAVLTAIVAGVFAVTATMPAVRFVHAAREVLVAVLIAAGGALAVVGLEPEVALGRFEYTILAGGLALALVIVYRLGAGLHGLGRRGIAIVIVGGVALAGTLAYAEALRRYGSPGLVDGVDSAVVWMRSHFGAVARPLQALIGVPALAWGCHMRARRRQGWWVCAFGAAGHDLGGRGADAAARKRCRVSPRRRLQHGHRAAGRVRRDPRRPRPHRPTRRPRPTGRGGCRTAARIRAPGAVALVVPSGVLATRLHFPSG